MKKLNLFIVSLIFILLANNSLITYADGNTSDTAMILFQGDNVAIQGKPFRYAKVWFKGDKVKQLHMGVVFCSDYVVYLPYYIASPEETLANPYNIEVGSYTYNHTYLSSEHQDGLEFPNSFSPQAYEPLIFRNTNINVEGGTVYCIGAFPYNEKYLAETPKITEDNFKVRFDGFVSVKRIDVNSNWSDSMMTQYVMWLTDGTTAKPFFTDAEGNLSNGLVYDLEIPKNVSCEKIDYTIWEEIIDWNKFFKDKDLYKITWEQSKEIDVSGWLTEIWDLSSVTTKEYTWSKKVKKEFEWEFAFSVHNYEHLAKIRVQNLPNVHNYLFNDNNSSKFIEFKTNSDFMIRNKYVDSQGFTHYSNFVYLEKTDNGYKSFEVNGNLTEDENNAITDNAIKDAVNPNSTEYDGSISTPNNNVSGVANLKNLFNDLKDLPAFFNQVFSFLPSFVWVALSSAIVILIALAVIKLII